MNDALSSPGANLLADWVTRDSVVPPWQQIADVLRQRIASGEYPAGRKVPSIIALSGATVHSCA